jgi:hypothetical protein
MGILFDFSFGSFSLIHDVVHVRQWESPTGETRWRRGGRPFIDPFEIPTGGLRQRVYVVEAMYTKAPVNWWLCGTLVQYIESSVSPSISGLGLPGLAIASHKVPLFRQSLIVLEQTGQEFRLGFEPVPWLPEFHLKIWRWEGAVRDEILEEIASQELTLEEIQQALSDIKIQTDKIP